VDYSVTVDWRGTRPPVVPTTTGLKPATALGATLVGERVVDAPTGFRYWPGAGEASREACTQALDALREANVDTIVDSSPIECRDVELIRQCSEASGVAVVCCTGLAVATDVSATFRSLPAPRLANVFVDELTDRVPGTEIRAGAIGLAFGEPHAFDATVLLATAFAHSETGAPILLRAPTSQLDMRAGELVARGVDPERIVVTGLDSRETTFGLIEALGKRGVHLGFSSLGCAGNETLPLAGRAALVAYARARVGAGRICLATGSAAARLAAPGAAAPDGTPTPAAEALRAFGEQLESFGVNASELRAMLTDGVDDLFTPPAELT
jgi:predicted metal-dependent phosphotriesterase family hydrolase